MKIQYYEYETVVFNPFMDNKYTLFYGYLFETPFGIMELFEEDEINIWDSFSQFNERIEKFYPRNFVIKKLKGSY